MTKDLFDIRDRVAVITGGSGLIGNALVQALDERGAKVVSLDVLPSKISSGTIGEMCCDVTNSEAVARCADLIRSRFGRVDILVNSHHYKPAGFTEARAESFPDELWNSILNVNLTATFRTCREFGRIMLEQGKGSIINVGSTYGIVSSNPDLYEGNTLGNPVAYSASKGGVIMLTKYLGAYWAEKGVRVNCITPHGVENGQSPEFVKRFAAKSPMRRLMTADELVGAVLFLGSDASSYVTSSNVLLEGGWTAW